MRIIIKIAGIISVFFLALAVCLVTFNVGARYLFNYGVPWCEEAIRYSVIFATFFGLTLSLVKNNCMKIDVLLQVLHGKIQYFINYIGTMIQSITICGLAYFSYLLVIESMESGQITPSTDFPMYFPYIAVTVGIMFCAAASIYALYRAFKGDVEI